MNSLYRPTSSSFLFILVTIVTVMNCRSFLQFNFLRKISTICETQRMCRVARSKDWKRSCTTAAGEQVKTSAATSAVTSAADKKWDIKVLKLEVNRVYMRTFKKVGQANERLAKALIEYEEVINTPDVSMERMEDCPNPDILKADLTALQGKLTKVLYLEEELKSIKSIGNDRFPALASLADELGISDVAAPVQERGPKKIKAKAPTGPRKPYHVYTGFDGIEIRVGRGASDNDELSCNPAHRDGPDWWLHVAGVAGSHVVIRTHDDLLPEKFRETLIDAACLAVVNSKGSQSSKVAVTYTRCRSVSKPGGAKPGLVYLTGDCSTVKVDVRAEAVRLERLEKNKE